MEWFLAKLIYRFQSPSEPDPVQFDEQLRLVQADDALHAFHKAQQIGHQEQLIADAQTIHQINWHFIDVTELYKLNNMIDGAEVLSQICLPADSMRYQQEVRLKAGYLLSNCTDQFLQAL
ncbi:DUF4288 domain-containing protein [Sediminibacterium goheungense]|uniref:Uncharacterized protein DUF4288 n=1 Tax=Sediminibacterium goheungense TaxID=1086393 RepID=A0A4R6IWI9_9BACT|nr:DUF4288 domain-containing protein [Sediminibacterium goheungense]TDO27070.1 uncharacterized protein DUF4288 [Sediminibacterium goheungense]